MTAKSGTRAIHAQARHGFGGNATPYSAADAGPARSGRSGGTGGGPKTYPKRSPARQGCCERAIAGAPRESPSSAWIGPSQASGARGRPGTTDAIGRRGREEGTSHDGFGPAGEEVH